MKPLLIASLLALATPQANAGDIDLGFGFGFHNRHVNVALGFRTHHRHHRYRRAYRCTRYWVPGHYEVVERRVYVPGYQRRIYEPARYGFRIDACGFRVRYRIRAGGYRIIRTPGHYEIRRERVYYPGYYEYACDTPGHHHDRYR